MSTLRFISTALRLPNRSLQLFIKPCSLHVSCSLATDKPQPIKRPLTPFVLFSKEKYPEITKANPGVKMTGVTEMISELWRRMTDEEKAPFVLMNKNLTAEYKETLSSLSKEELQEIREQRSKQRQAKKKRRQLSEKRKLTQDKPKRPPSAFLLYYASVREDVQHLPFTAQSKKVADMWSTLGQDEKEMWAAEHRELNKTFQAELKQWEEGMKEQGHPELIRGYRPPRPKRKTKPKKKTKAKKTKAKKKSGGKDSKSRKQRKKNVETQTKDNSWMREE